MVSSVCITVLLDLGVGIAPRARHAQRKGGIVEHRHMRPHRIGLEHHADIALIGGDEGTGCPIEHHPVRHADAALRRLLQPCDRAQGRGLAASRRAEQRIELAFLDVETDIADAAGNTAVAEDIGLGQIFDLQHDLIAPVRSLADRQLIAPRQDEEGDAENRHDRGPHAAERSQFADLPLFHEIEQRHRNHLRVRARPAAAPATWPVPPAGRRTASMRSAPARAAATRYDESPGVARAGNGRGLFKFRDESG